jgi:hypothetical protein
MILRSVMLAAALLLAGCNQPRANNESVAATPGAASSIAGVRALPEAEQRATAFKTVFGKAEPVAGEEGFSTKAGKLLWQGDHAVLITVTESEDACHACSGSLGIYYLVARDGAFRVTGKFPKAVPGNGYGQPPNTWSVSEKFGPVPVIYSEAGWMGQGFSCMNFRLTELRADKPVEVANVPIFYDDSDTGYPDHKGQLEGKFGPIVPGKSFTLNFTGFKRFSQIWVRKGDIYVLSGADRMETC